MKGTGKTALSCCSACPCATVARRARDNVFACPWTGCGISHNLPGCGVCFRVEPLSLAHPRRLIAHAAGSLEQHEGGDISRGWPTGLVENDRTAASSRQDRPQQPARVDLNLPRPAGWRIKLGRARGHSFSGCTVPTSPTAQNPAGRCVTTTTSQTRRVSKGDGQRTSWPPMRYAMRCDAMRRGGGHQCRAVPQFVFPLFRFVCFVCPVLSFRPAGRPSHVSCRWLERGLLKRNGRASGSQPSRAAVEAPGHLEMGAPHRVCGVDGDRLSSTERRGRK